MIDLRQGKVNSAVCSKVISYRSISSGREYFSKELSMTDQCEIPQDDNLDQRRNKCLLWKRSATQSRSYNRQICLASRYDRELFDLQKLLQAIIRNSLRFFVPFFTGDKGKLFA